jgi:hypothetical protein
MVRAGPLCLIIVASKAIALKTPVSGSMSVIAILRQSSSLNSESKRGEPLLAFVIPAIRSFP